MARTPEEDKSSVARVASLQMTSDEDRALLIAEIEGLKAKLAIEKEARSQAEEAALAAVNAQSPGILQSEIMEMPTGKKIAVKKCVGYETVSYKDDGRPTLKPKFKEVDVPTYFYKIDLPPVGGEAITINGLPLCHGTAYEFDIDTLRTVKDIVFRCWKHDAEIHGRDENVYRRPQQMTLRGAR